MFEKWFGPSLKVLLIQQLHASQAQSAADRKLLMDQIREQQRLAADTQVEVIGLMREIAHGVQEQSKSFNRYLDLAAPSGAPTVRVMDDYTEVLHERQRTLDREKDAALQGVPAHLQNLIGDTALMFGDLRADFSGMS